MNMQKSEDERSLEKLKKTGYNTGFASGVLRANLKLCASHEL
jgi:hypothetical protein